MIPDIYKVKTIGNGFLAVMAKPVSGEWIENEFTGIASEGILQIVSLLELNEAYDVGLRDEKVLAEKNGMLYISFPIKDRGIPESAEQFGKLASKIYHQIEIGKSTVIHCRSGIGRAAILAAATLLFCGFKTDDAFKHIAAKRGVRVPDTEEQAKWVETNERIILNYA